LYKHVVDDDDAVKRQLQNQQNRW